MIVIVGVVFCVAVRGTGALGCDSGGKLRFEIRCSYRAHCVAATEDVGSVGVAVWFQAVEHGEHFCCVAAAAEDDEEVGWGVAEKWGFEKRREAAEAKEEELRIRLVGCLM